MQLVEGEAVVVQPDRVCLGPAVGWGQQESPLTPLAFSSMKGGPGAHWLRTWYVKSCREVLYH